MPKAQLLHPSPAAGLAVCVALGGTFLGGIVPAAAAEASDAYRARAEAKAKRAY